MNLARGCFLFDAVGFVCLAQGEILHPRTEVVIGWKKCSFLRCLMSIRFRLIDFTFSNLVLMYAFAVSGSQLDLEKAMMDCLYAKCK